jgi:hypothetical protein
LAGALKLDIADTLQPREHVLHAQGGAVRGVVGIEGGVVSGC